MKAIAQDRCGDARENAADLETLAQLAEDGAITPAELPPEVFESAEAP